MSEGPAITVALPVYNGMATIQECLDALAAQTCDDFVVQIFDNASTDGTSALCQARAQADPRFVHHRNSGIMQNRCLPLMTQYFNIQEAFPLNWEC